VPLPAGRVATAPAGLAVGIDPKNLTPGERKALQALGWTENVPVPSDMADLVNGLRSEATSEQLPVDPAKPPPAWNPIPVSELTPAKQAEIQQLMRTMTATELETKEARRAMGPPVPGLNQAQAVAQQAADIEIVDDRASTPAKPAPASAAPVPAAAEAPATTPPSETGADAKPAVCPHCHHSMSLVSVIEPTRGDKIAFLHSMIGEKAYAKEYPLFGGRMVVGLRNLTLRELDVLFRQASLDEREGKFKLESEYWETVNRYRLCIQLQSFRAPGPGGFIRDFPDGLSKETNPAATAFWEVDVPADGTAFPAIQEYLFDKVFTNEAVFRVVYATCQEFNRLVARMEAMADSPDFWPPIEASA
jgi:hypothetical protein